MTKHFSKLRDIPLLTEQGFKKMSVPQPILTKINELYSLLKPMERIEQFEGLEKYINNDLRKDTVYVMPLDLYPNMRDQVLLDFRDIFYDWVKVAIEPYCVYGIRSYKAGSVLNLHVDRLSTHHVSAIVCVDKSVIEDWALDICDHAGEWHKVYLNPGEMVLYESAICQHGRLKPLNGEFYNNLFVHYSLA